MEKEKVLLLTLQPRQMTVIFFLVWILPLFFSGTTPVAVDGFTPWSQRRSLSSSNLVARVSKEDATSMTEESTAPIIDDDEDDDEGTRRFFHPTFEHRPLVDVATALTTKSPTPAAERALASLAATILALLAGDEEAADSLVVRDGKSHKKRLIRRAFRAYDVCGSGTLSVEEARLRLLNTKNRRSSQYVRRHLIGTHSLREHRREDRRHSCSVRFTGIRRPVRTAAS